MGPGGGFAYQRSVTTSWDRIARAHTLVRASDMGLLPPHVSFPDIRSVLVDGRVSPATVPLGQGGGGDDADPDEILVLPGLDSCDSACHPHAQRAASAVVASLEFLSLHVSSTPQGCARLMDGSVPRGPFSFWRRVPVAFSPSPGRPPIMAFSHADDFASQLALDLMLLPPVPVPSGSPPATAASTVCHRCAPSVADPSIAALGTRHFTRCPHGLILQRTCHNPVVEALAAVFTAALGPSAVMVDRWGDDRAMVAFMQGPGAALTHTPDIVALGLEAPGVYTCIEVKTFDPSGPTHLATHHTATTRLGAHAAAVLASRRDEYRLTGPRALPPPRLTSASHSSPLVYLAPSAPPATASSPFSPAVPTDTCPSPYCQL